MQCTLVYAGKFSTGKLLRIESVKKRTLFDECELVWVGVVLNASNGGGWVRGLRIGGGAGLDVSVDVRIFLKVNESIALWGEPYL